MCKDQASDYVLFLFHWIIAYSCPLTLTYCIPLSLINTELTYTPVL